MGNWFNLVIILVAVGGPVLGRVMQEVDKKRKARQKQKDAEARELEALRTGRVSTEVRAGAISPPRASTQPRRTQSARTLPTSPTTPAARNATQRMQELARKRQEQLNELRRRQQAARQRAAGKPPTPAGQPASRQRTAQPRPTAAPAQKHAPLAQKSSGLRLRNQSPSHTSTPRESSIHELSVSDRVLHPTTESAHAAAKPVKLLGKPMTPAEWRRFIVARELLDPPLALRQNQSGSPL
ncbi:MAG: hypothetical protein Q9O74_04355 [Planctomycetota bacterium]|nr:hypothetical protein [Planctomycetota bacterium]